MTQERKNEVYDKMLAWVFEHVKNDKELFRILHEEFGMTKEEFHDNSIESLDYLFEENAQEQQVLGRIAIYHLHQDDEDYHFTDELNNNFYRAARKYKQYWKSGDRNLTLDTIAHSYFDAHQPIDELTFSVLVDSKKHDPRINEVFEIDLDENVIHVLNNPLERWHTYSCQDVVDAVETAEQLQGSCNEIRRRNEFNKYLSGREIEIRGKDMDTAMREFVEMQMQ